MKEQFPKVYIAPEDILKEFLNLPDLISKKNIVSDFDKMLENVDSMSEGQLSKIMESNLIIKKAKDSIESLFRDLFKLDDELKKLEDQQRKETNGLNNSKLNQEMANTENSIVGITNLIKIKSDRKNHEENYKKYLIDNN